MFFERSNELARLSGSRAATVSVVLALVVAIAACFTPLLKVPGYELSELLTLLGALVAAPLAAAARPEAKGDSPLRLALFVALWVAGLQIQVVSIVALHALVASHCSPWRAFGFVALLPLPSALLAGALSAAAVATIPRARWAVALYLLGLVALLVHGAWPAYRGPVAFGYDHLLGYVPGPLYDENLPPPHALYLFRGLTLGLLALCWACLAAAPRLTIPVFALALLATGPLEHRLGTRTSVADLDRALGATRTFQGLTIHAPSELSEERLGELLREAAVARAQVAAVLQVSPATPVDVFFHRSADEKFRLTGAGQTHFTKPWLHQIQTEVDAPQVLRHELVHALAALWGGGPFGVGQKLVFNVALVEGLAEAVDWPADRYTLDEWSAGMKAAGLLPNVAELFDSPFAFYAASQARAYTVAGSFVHWLLATEGPAKVASLYRTGDFEASLGKPLGDAIRKPSVSDAYGLFLQKIAVDPQLAHAAAERFRARPFFARPCGREVAGLRADANAALDQGNPQRAASLFGRCAELDPGDVGALEARWRALLAAKDPKAPAALAALLASPAVDDAVRARVALFQGDQALTEHREPEARAFYDQARTLGLDPPSDRAAQIRLLALDAPELAEPLQRYFNDGADALSLLDFSEAAAHHPTFAPLPYLLGLQLANHRQTEWSLRELDHALALGLPPDLAGQALRVEVEEQVRALQLEGADARLQALAALPGSAAAKRQEEDLRSKVELTRKLFAGVHP